MRRERSAEGRIPKPKGKVLGGTKLVFQDDPNPPPFIKALAEVRHLIEDHSRDRLRTGDPTDEDETKHEGITPQESSAG